MIIKKNVYKLINIIIMVIFVYTLMYIYVLVDDEYQFVQKTY